MLEMKHGRPETNEGRLNKEIRSYDLLDSLGVEFDRIDHAAAMTMDDCRDVDEALCAVICKNLFLCNRQKTKFYLLMIPSEKKFKTKDLSALLGVARLSFGDPEYMERFLDITPGSLSVLGIMNDTSHSVQLVIDKDVLDGEYIGCHPCINTSSIRIKISDLLEKVIPAMKHEPIYVDLPDCSEE